MMKKKIFVLGYFGYYKEQIDGQTIKTRNIFDSIKNNKPNVKLKLYDTQEFQFNKFSLLKLLRLLLWCDQLIYLPGQNNLKNILSIIRFFKYFSKFEIIYIVVGGWLHEFLAKNKNLIAPLSKFKAILIESKSLRDKLIVDFNFKNVFYFPNYRNHNFQPNFEDRENVISGKNKKFKIVFMARITRAKGVDVVFKLANYIKNNDRFSNDVIIDFYGPLDKIDENYFTEQINSLDFASYHGILPPQDIYQTLTDYDLLLLPTRYKGEGFPGTILDAYISGIPVIVSDWKYIPEYVDESKTGFVYSLENNQELYDYVYRLYTNPKELRQMKASAFQKSKEFSEKVAMKILREYLN